MWTEPMERVLVAADSQGVDVAAPRPGTWSSRRGWRPYCAAGRPCLGQLTWRPRMGGSLKRIMADMVGQGRQRNVSNVGPSNTWPTRPQLWSSLMLTVSPESRRTPTISTPWMAPGSQEVALT